MSSRQVRAIAIAIAREVLSVGCALRQSVHIIFRFKTEDAVEKFSIAFAIAACAQVAARHPD